MAAQWPLLFLAAVLTLHAGCSGPSETPPAPPRAIDEVAVDVETVALRLAPVSQHLSAPGSVVARRESRIGAEISGRIVRVHVSEGDRIDDGAPLFEIDRAPFEIALRQAEAGSDVAHAERQQLEADLRRAEALGRENVLSHQEIERLTTSLAVAQARERQMAEAVALARHNLERTLVRAPFAGSVAERLADEGTTALVMPQTIVVVLQETAELEAHVAVPESQMELIRDGDSALVRIEGISEAVRTRVASVSDTIDPATRTYLVKMPVPNPDHAIKAGVFAHVEIQPRRSADVVLAPRDAIRVEDGRTRLLVVRDGHVAALPVEVGTVTEASAEIRSGATAGEMAVVGEAAHTIAPGMRVRVRAAGPDGAS